MLLSVDASDLRFTAVNNVTQTINTVTTHLHVIFPIGMIEGDLQRVPPTMSIFISLNLDFPPPTHSAAKRSPSSGVSGSQTYAG